MDFLKFFVIIALVFLTVEAELQNDQNLDPILQQLEQQNQDTHAHAQNKRTICQLSKCQPQSSYVRHLVIKNARPAGYRYAKPKIQFRLRAPLLHHNHGGSSWKQLTTTASKPAIVEVPAPNLHPADHVGHDVLPSFVNTAVPVQSSQPPVAPILAPDRPVLVPQPVPVLFEVTKPNLPVLPLGASFNVAPLVPHVHSHVQPYAHFAGTRNFLPYAHHAHLVQPQLLPHAHIQPHLVPQAHLQPQLMPAEHHHAHFVQPHEHHAHVLQPQLVPHVHVQPQPLPHELVPHQHLIPQPLPHEHHAQFLQSQLVPHEHLQIQTLPHEHRAHFLQSHEHVQPHEHQFLQSQPLPHEHQAQFLQPHQYQSQLAQDWDVPRFQLPLEGEEAKPSLSSGHVIQPGQTDVQIPYHLPAQHAGNAAASVWQQGEK